MVARGGSLRERQISIVGPLRGATISGSMWSSFSSPSSSVPTTVLPKTRPGVVLLVAAPTSA